MVFYVYACCWEEWWLVNLVMLVKICESGHYLEERSDCLMDFALQIKTKVQLWATCLRSLGKWDLEHGKLRKGIILEATPSIETWRMCLKMGLSRLSCLAHPVILPRRRLFLHFSTFLSRFCAQLLLLPCLYMIDHEHMWLCELWITPGTVWLVYPSMIVPKFDSKLSAS